MHIEHRTIQWYRTLPTVERVAVNAWLNGEPRLLAWLWPSRDVLQRYDFDYLQRWLGIRV